MTRKTQTEAVEAVKTPRTRKTRQPVKPLNKTPEVVAANAKAEQERKKASKKALRESLQPVKPAKPVPAEKTEEQRQAEHEAYLAALRVDAEALGVDPDAYIAEQLQEVKTGYVGPMLALRTAVKNYVKAANGQPCCGDELASLCGAHPRETVVTALVAALGLGHNPYAHLNPGQQSMNLRNKARAALKSGLIQVADVDACLRAHSALAVAAK